MTFDGSDYKREHHKFRCPCSTKKIDSCPLWGKRSKSNDDRTVHIKFDDDIKYNGPVRYKSKQWIELYKNHTSCERINNRILNDYQFANNSIRSKK